MQYRRILVASITLLLVLAFAAPAFGAGNGPDAGQVGARGGKVVPGEYIVVMKPGTGQAATDAAIVDAKRAAGSESSSMSVHHRYSAALNGFAGALPASSVAALRHNPLVDYVEPDQVVTIDGSQSNPPWGLDRIDQRSLPLNGTYNYNSTGAGVTAYIIDTGILTSHTDFGGRASVGTDKIGDGRNGIDCNGHGTHVAGTVGGSKYGVAKGVRLVAVRVLDCNGSGSTSGVIAGVDWVTKNHRSPAVANMSLGGGPSSALDTAVRTSINSGVTYSIAAGNSNRDACYYSPARVTQAITVAATTSSDSRASYSNYGSCVDLFAPGSSITSDWISSTTATNTISGTSMATPHVTGVAARYLAGHQSATAAQVQTAIIGAATSGVVRSPGYGTPNRLLFSNY